MSGILQRGGETIAQWRGEENSEAQQKPWLFFCVLPPATRTRHDHLIGNLDRGPSAFGLRSLGTLGHALHQSRRPFSPFYLTIFDTAQVSSAGEPNTLLVHSVSELEARGRCAAVSATCFRRAHCH